MAWNIPESSIFWLTIWISDTIACDYLWPIILIEKPGLWSLWDYLLGVVSCLNVRSQFSYFILNFLGPGAQYVTGHG